MIPDAPWRVVVVSQIPRIARGYAELVRAMGHEPVAHLAVRMPPQFEVTPRMLEFGGKLLVEAPHELDLVFPADKTRMAEILRWYEPDVLLCTAFPWRIPAEVLAVPRIACINGHPSLLPRYRGPMPMAWAVRNGETEIGMTYHLMDEQFDTGAILAQKAVPLAEDETNESLWTKLAEASAELIPIAFQRLANGDRGDPQEGGDYQSLFDDDYAFVDPGQTVAEVQRQVRAWHFAFVGKNLRGPLLERDGETIRLLETSPTEVEGAERLDCADGPLWIVESEPAG
ncbi:MAG TPA: formyltransferase family protein [Gaiellaceae bacterium]|nr:formyltransferase family protein [Gaiellaceae bacterium]